MTARTSKRIAAASKSAAEKEQLDPVDGSRSEGKTARKRQKNRSDSASTPNNRVSKPSTAKSRSKPGRSTTGKSTASTSKSAAKNLDQAKSPQRTVPNKPQTEQHVTDAGQSRDEEPRPWFWLMKAEPESRIEKGHDVKFSIDDLRGLSPDRPEAWDGVRNVVARNNMRAMRRSELAFFYHSNCKVPGIVGLMEIVREASVDESAFDPDHPYYDAKSSRDAPKWSVVHVTFREKFPEMITLRMLQAEPRLQGMQLLRMSRLSVSRVERKFVDVVLEMARERGASVEGVLNEP